MKLRKVQISRLKGIHLLKSQDESKREIFSLVNPVYKRQHISGGNIFCIIIDCPVKEIEQMQLVHTI